MSTNTIKEGYHNQMAHIFLDQLLSANKQWAEIWRSLREDTKVTTIIENYMLSLSKEELRQYLSILKDENK